MRSATPLVRGTRMGANYGYDKVRFPGSLRVGRHVRGLFTLSDIVEKRADGLFMFNYAVSVEGEGHDKPVVTADWKIARWMAHD
jgi:acyl dehydratase